MKYRRMHEGEIIKDTDEYESFYNGNYLKVVSSVVGTKLLDVNALYYRRPLIDLES